MECDRPSIARNRCSTHYSAWRESADFTPVVLMTESERFWSKVDRSGGINACWWWTGTVGSGGYGDFYVHNGSPRIQKAHRYSYGLHYGAIPDDVEIDHLCHTKKCPTPGVGDKCRSCVNPLHLEAVSRQTNILRGQSPERTREHFFTTVTHCPKGHEYTPENIRWEYRANGKGTRHCRECNRIRRRDFLARRRASRLNL